MNIPVTDGWIIPGHGPWSPNPGKWIGGGSSDIDGWSTDPTDI